MGKVALGNPLKVIMADTGRKSDISNRSYFVKSVNTVLLTGLVKIQLAPKGKVWLNEKMNKGKKFDLRVDAGGWVSFGYYGDNMDANDILRNIGKLLLVPEVKEKIKADVFVPEHCFKCNGLGIIPMYHYYCNGICFDCCGLGCNLKDRTRVDIIAPETKDLKGRKYLNLFVVSKLYTEQFPSGVENIKPIQYIGHPTAEKFLGKKDNVYYIHQPVCKANGWYAIPENDFEKFKVEYEKLFKINL
jgi:hypothetical protein